MLATVMIINEQECDLKRKAQQDFSAFSFKKKKKQKSISGIIFHPFTLDAKSD